MSEMVLGLLGRVGDGDGRGLHCIGFSELFEGFRESLPLIQREATLRTP